MSRAYEISVKVSCHDNNRFLPIMESSNDVFDMGEWSDENGVLQAGCDGYIHSDETEQGISQKIAKAIMKANGGPCNVEVCCLYLEYAPSTTYEFDSPEDFT